MPRLLSSRKQGNSYWPVALCDHHDKKASNSMYRDVSNNTNTGIDT